MRVVWLTRFGGPEVLVAGEAPDPVPGPGQALVAVQFAGVTFIETVFRAGAPGPFTGQPPLVPGNGVGGLVAAVGPGVDPGLVGRRVVSGTGGSGGYAEQAAVDAAGMVEVPPPLAMDAATALLADGRTATMLVRAAALRPGDRVLVEAAAGGVGTLLVQLARTAGARVVAAAGGPQKLRLPAELGAEFTVDYTRPDWPQWTRDAVGGLDAVFDGVGGGIGRSAFELLEPGGRMLRYGFASGTWCQIGEQEAAQRGVALIQPRPAPEQLREYTAGALGEAAAGRLRPVIGQRYPLEQAAAAHAAIESRATVGKSLLVV
ncbi:MAG: zinc-binding dehydrogenase [Micromonosporaceae bacterium]|nr:zinc-binding dehydrogenase [Micromonosporaceae bacterium]